MTMIIKNIMINHDDLDHDNPINDDDDDDDPAVKEMWTGLCLHPPVHE